MTPILLDILCSDVNVNLKFYYFLYSNQNKNFAFTVIMSSILPLQKLYFMLNLS